MTTLIDNRYFQVGAVYRMNNSTWFDYIPNGSLFTVLSPPVRTRIIDMDYSIGEEIEYDSYCWSVLHDGSIKTLGFDNESTITAEFEDWFQRVV
jgi:hypothetical protein